jgi:virulence-associated protein VagC
MKTKLDEKGLFIPKELLEGVEEVEVRKEHRRLLIIPIRSNDPLLELGAEPVEDDIDDASVDHDHYLYSQE